MRTGFNKKACGLVVSVLCLCVVAAQAAQAQTKVLSGMPDFCTVDLGSSESRPLLVDSPDFSTVTFQPADARPVNVASPLGTTPEYVSWYGCTPTSAGMMVAYWDAQPNRANLYKKGDSQVWSGDGTTGTKRMVTSLGHINQSGGHDTSGCTSGLDKCISCFLHTNPTTGSTSYLNVAPGLEGFVEWDDTSAYDMKDGYEATAVMEDVAFWRTTGQAFTYNDFKAEIDAGRPMLLGLMTYYSEWKGHSVVGYGYQDNMFDIKVSLPGGSSVDLTVGGFAVRDTWANGIAQSNWYDWAGGVVYPVISGGVEWWPFVEFAGSSYSALWDWMLSDGVSLDVVPEPAILSLLALGGLALIRRRRK